MIASSPRVDVADALDVLAGELESLSFGPDWGDLAAERDRLVGIIRSYLIPRASDPGRPMVVVLVGPTGSGKSTLLNSLSGLDISTTGALRPTTTAPVVLAKSGTEERYRTIGGVGCEVRRGRARVLDSLVLVDAPDLDSTSTGHRAMAETLIDNADIVVFVTSALRYADDVPWQVLRRAVSRGTPVIHVLNRVGSASSGAIVDFRSRLSAAGLDDDLITVTEHHLADEAQRVPSLAVRSLRNRLDEHIANQEELTAEVFTRVLSSTLKRATDLTHTISDFTLEVDDLEASLSVRLADRVAALDLTGVARDLYQRAPDRSSRRAVRIWRNNVERSDPEAIAKATNELIDRIHSVVQSDVRRWLAEERTMLRGWNVSAGDVIAGVGLEAQSQLEGWVVFVARVAADHDDAAVWLHQAVLLAAVTTEEAKRAAGLAIGADADVLVERARRELLGRLGLIYEQVGRLVTGEIRARHGSVDVDDLRATIGAVTVLAPVHA